PGVAEIRRAETLIRERFADPVIDIFMLHGTLDFDAQDRAIAPAVPGRRKVVLATSIAETSLTIEGVRGVVDSGLARVPRYEPDVGPTRLETVRVSRAAADQRRGRAGRTEPGVCYRLWDEPQTSSLEPYAQPEILAADLSALVLDLAQWGVADPARLTFLDQPPAPSLNEARTLLAALGAIDGAGRITPEGKLLNRLPLPPRLARMVVDASREGAGMTAAEIAAVLAERGLGSNDVDLRHRIDGLRRDRSARAAEARRMAGRWAEMARSPDGAKRNPGTPSQPGTVSPTASSTGSSRDARGAPDYGPQEPPSIRATGSGGTPVLQVPPTLGAVLALAYPERIARNRGGATGAFLLANGRGAYVDPASPLAREPFLAVAELIGSAAQGRITLAAAIDLAAIESRFADRIESREVVSVDAGTLALRCRRSAPPGA